MKANHILVDFENVPHLPLDRIGEDNVIFHLFIGENQNSVSTDLLVALHKHASKVELVRTRSTGKDALDFVLACKLGELVTATPDAYFSIVSKDKGFDALIGYLMERQIHVSRCESLEQVPILRPKVHLSTAERADQYRQHLVKIAKTRPTTRRTLLSSINAIFAKQLSPEELEAIAAHLQKTGTLTLSETGKVTYAGEQRASVDS
jgi:hypothetical protein